MKKTKICIVSLYAYHLFNPEVYSRFGGAELQVYNLATQLAQDPSFEVNFLVGDFGQPDAEVRQGVTLDKFYNPNQKLKYIRVGFSFLHLWRLLSKIDADLYIQRAAGLETGEVSLFCKFKKKKFVYMVAHDGDLESTKPSWMGRGLLSSIRWSFFKSGLRNAALIFTQHKSQQENLTKLYHKTGVIRNSAHRILDTVKTENKNAILWVARADDWKQPELFLRLAQSFPSEKFVMVMPESNNREYFSKIKIEAGKLGNLDFFDFVAADKIGGFFLNAKIFVNTSKFEGFPNTFIQAAKTKTPILSLNVNPDEMLEKNNIGFCANGDFVKLKTDLKKFLTDENFRKQTGENGYAYAKQKHDLEKIVKKDKELFLNLIQNKL